MRRLRYPFRTVALVVSLGVLLLAGGWVLDIARFLSMPLAIQGKGMRYTIPPGATLNTVARGLAQQGVLRRPRYLGWLGRLQGRATKIQAGEYEFQAGITAPELLDQIVKGGGVVQHAFTLVEGWTFAQVMWAIADNLAIAQTLSELDEAAIMARLGRPHQHPEGRFYPDTYYFTRGTPDVEVLRRAYEAMEATLGREWQGRAPGLPYMSPDEALIMASIVEKETALPEERLFIAGVFIRRLRLEMPLQTDPTVIYGLGNAFDGNLRRLDLEWDTPYNTYLRRGLPPTPIAMPGAASIHAALHPAEGRTLYFVARGDGSHEFSETLQEHNRAVAKYQLRLPGS
jgi:UPF0755 protein